MKTGFIEDEYSDAYGRIMNHRHVSDYDLVPLIDEGQVYDDLRDARKFVKHVRHWLHTEGWL